MRDVFSDPELVLQKLNQCWGASCTEVPEFDAWRQALGLPNSWSSLVDYQHRTPLTGREEFRDWASAQRSRGGARQQLKSTGGSTAEPVVFPVAEAEQARHREALWRARGALGITRSMRALVIWGMPDMLSRRPITRLLRALKDRVRGYVRLSAYDLSAKTLPRVVERACRASIDYVVGYSTALDLIAQEGLRKGRRRNAPVEAVIATAESLPREQSRSDIEDFFGGPVRMEYGASETGLLAQQIGLEEWMLFQDHYLYEYLDHPSGMKQLCISALYPRVVPMFRYQLGDLISFPSHSEEMHWRAVVGRCNNVIRLPSGRRFHSELITHALKDETTIAQYQFVHRRGKPPLLRVMAMPGAEVPNVSRIRQRMMHFDPDLRVIEICIVETMEKTVLGKHRFVIDEHHSD